MKERKKIGIIYGPEFHDNWVDGIYRGFLGIGVDVVVLHCNQPISSNAGHPESKKTRLLAKLKAYVQKLDRAKVIKRIIYLFADVRLFVSCFTKRFFHPRKSIFVIYVWITPKLLWVSRVFHAMGIKQYFWAGDPPLKHPECWPFFPYLDKIGMVDADWEVPLNYKDKFEVLSFGGDEKLFVPIEKRDIPDKFFADVSFIGLFGEERAKALSCIKNVNLKIYGHGWDEVEKKYGFSKGVIQGPVTTLEVNQIFCASKINIGTLVTGMTSRRLFDIASSGGFQISEYRTITPGLFGGSISLFKNPGEMLSLIDFYLANKEKRDELAKKSRAIFLERHTFTHRARAILSSLRYP